MGDTKYFGTSHGQQTITGGVQKLINGLTASPFVTVFNATASPGIVYIGEATVSTSNGFVLEPGHWTRVETKSDRDKWYVTTDGLSARVSYIAS